MKRVSLIREASANKRIALGLEYVCRSLEAAGYEIALYEGDKVDAYRELPGAKIYVGDRNTSRFLKHLEEEDLLLYHQPAPGDEGFYLSTVAGGLTVVSGGSDTGALYGAWSFPSASTGKGSFPMSWPLATDRSISCGARCWGSRRPSWSRPAAPMNTPSPPAASPGFMIRPSGKNTWR